MAWASVGVAASSGNVTANSTIQNLTLTGQAGSGANIGDVLVGFWCAQNASTVSGTDEAKILSVTDSAGNTWNKVREVTAAAAGSAAQGGTVCSLWYASIDRALTTSNVVTAIFGSSATNDAQCGRVWRFTRSGTVKVQGSTFLIVTTSLAGTIDLTARDDSELLRFRATAANSTLSAFTTTAGWASAGIVRASNTTRNLVYAEFNIVSATTAASAPSITAATTQASIYALFEEHFPMGDSQL
jgi:hypothetical protein